MVVVGDPTFGPQKYLAANRKIIYYLLTQPDYFRNKTFVLLSTNFTGAAMAVFSYYRCVRMVITLRYFGI